MVIGLVARDKHLVEGSCWCFGIVDLDRKVFGIQIGWVDVGTFLYFFGAYWFCLFLHRKFGWFI